MCRWLVSVRLFMVTVLLPSLALALQAPPANRVLPDLDVRQELKARHGPGQIPVERLDAAAALEAAAGTPLRVRWNAVSGWPHWLHAYGRPVAGILAQAPEQAARRFLTAEEGLFGFSKAEIADLELVFLERADSGATHVGFRQIEGGIPVFQGILRVDLDRAGRIIAAGMAQARPGLSGTAYPVLDATDAVRVALDAAGLDGAAVVNGPSTLAERRVRFETERTRSPVEADLRWFPLVESARLAWRFMVEPEGYPALYEILVDAGNGEILFRQNVLRYADTRARVFTNNPDRAPRSLEVVFDDTVNVLPDDPAGWIAADTTEGNNVIAQDDRAADDETTLGVMPICTPGIPQAFDPVFSADPFSDLDLGVVNLFWAINRAHDYFYRIGFTESAGNFQAANFGRGGLGGDPVLGDAQDGADTLLDGDPGNDISDNANFSTPEDGLPGRMQMYLWVDTPPAVDSDLDVDVIFHEYCHGVSTRLVGGRGVSLCLLMVQGGAMGEGWGDFFAGSHFDDPVVVEYSTKNPVRGVRTAPMDADTYTYGDLCTIASGCEVHADGEIWAQNLWELRARFIAAYGYHDGRRAVEQLIIDGMKFAPCNPSFLDVRDAMIMADEVRNAGANTCLIWDVFASNGMGAAALDETGGDESLPVEDFTLPEACDPGAGLAQVSWWFDDVGCSATARITVVDADLVLPSSVDVTSDDAGDRLNLPLAEGPAGPPVYMTAAFPVEGVPDAGSVNTSDGVLQAVRGNTLRAVYHDDTSGADVEADATLTCLADVSLVRYRIVEGTCDDDTVPNFPDLPGFLDAGESAVLEMTLANNEPFALEDVSVTVTSVDPTKVTVAPASPVHLDRIEPVTGTHVAPAVLRFLVAADPSVSDGETVELAVELTSPAYDGTLAPLNVPLTLQQDYLVDTASFDETFDPGSPTVGAWTHAPLSPSPPGDEWTLVTCQSASPPSSYKNGGGDPDCDDYTDDQGDPYLASPPIRFESAGVLAARPTHLHLEHRIQLAVPIDPFGGICDAEIVALFLVNDPAAIDFADPYALLDAAIDGYTVIPYLGINDNTNDFVARDIDLTDFDFASLDFASDAYLTWAFGVDITNDLAPGGVCNSPLFDVQGEGYYLDNVALTWDEVRGVPQGTTCTETCKAMAVAAPPIVATCPDEPVVLSGAGSLVIGCGGALSYRWSGGELGAGTFGSDPDVTVSPAATETYTLDVQCDTEPACTASTTVTVASRSLPPLEGPIGNALRVTRGGGMLRFDWTGHSLEPRAYNIHQASTAADVSDARIGSQPSTAVDGAEWAELADPGATAFYEVYGRDLCTDESYVP